MDLHATEPEEDVEADFLGAWKIELAGECDGQHVQDHVHADHNASISNVERRHVKAATLGHLGVPDSVQGRAFHRDGDEGAGPEAARAVLHGRDDILSPFGACEFAVHAE